MSLLALGLAALAASTIALVARRKLDRSEPAAVAQAVPELGLDAVVSLDGEERWLRGALACEEGRTTPLTLYFTDEGQAHEAPCVATFAAPDRSVGWLRRCPLASSDEAPTTLLVDGVRFERAWCRPTRVVPSGTGSAPFETAQVACFVAPDDRLLATLHAPGHTLAFVGRRRDRSEIEVLGRVRDAT